MSGTLRVRVLSLHTDVGTPLTIEQEILKQVVRAKEEGVNLLVFPEMCTVGKTAGDILYYPAVGKAIRNCISKVAFETTGNFMCVMGTPVYMDNNIFNAVVVLHNKEIVDVFPDNTDIPLSLSDGTTLQVFVGTKKDVFQAPAADINLFLGAECACADGSSMIDVFRMYSELNANGVIAAISNVSESTSSCVYETTLCAIEGGEVLASFEGIPADSVEITTELFLPIIRSKRTNTYFGTTIPTLLKPNNVFEYRKIPQNPYLGDDFKTRLSRLNKCLNIQMAALHKRITATGVEKVVLGVSGGLDSLIALLLTALAFDSLKLKRENIICVVMPGLGSSDETQSLAEQISLSAGATVKIIDISQAVTDHLGDIGHDFKPDIAFENAQARERTQILMDIANMEGGIVLGTGDMSEAAMGFCTYNGDHMAMYNVNAGVPKTVLKEMAMHLSPMISDGFAAIARKIIEIPPSPELKPIEGEVRQDTQAQIGPFELNDFFMYYFVKHKLCIDHIVFLAKRAFSNYTEEKLTEQMKVFVKRYFSSQYKRACSPDGSRVFSIYLERESLPSDMSLNNIDTAFFCQ